jgi:hypothetical protein
MNCSTATNYSAACVSLSYGHMCEDQRNLTNWQHAGSYKLKAANDNAAGIHGIHQSLNSDFLSSRVLLQSEVDCESQQYTLYAPWHIKKLRKLGRVGDANLVCSKTF